MSQSYTSYEKQMKWQRARQRETEAKRQQKNQVDPGSFVPHIYHSRIRDFDGSAREINDRSSQRFIERLRKTQVPHPLSTRSLQSMESREGHRGFSSTLSAGDDVYPTRPHSTPHLASASEIVAGYSGQFRPDTNHHHQDDPAYHSSDEQPSRQSPQQSSRNFEDEDNIDDEVEDSSGSESGEPIIELLERERRQWQSERERLIQCIHMQQLEMSQRALAAHERAMDIAKDFAKVIEAFETRLEAVETNVQKELSGLRSMTESLLTAVNRLSSTSMSTSH